METFGIEVSRDALAQFAGAYANNRVNTGVVALGSFKDPGTNLLFANLVAAVDQGTPAPSTSVLTCSR